MGREEQLSRLFSELDSDRFGLTFDFGHHNLIYNECPLSQRTEKTKEMLRRFSEKIWVLHLHDNQGRRDDHAGLGTGEIEYAMVIPEVLQCGIRAYWSMELAGREAALASQALLVKLLEAQGVDPDNAGRRNDGHSGSES